MITRLYNITLLLLLVVLPASSANNYLVSREAVRDIGRLENTCKDLDAQIQEEEKRIEELEASTGNAYELSKAESSLLELITLVVNLKFRLISTYKNISSSWSDFKSETLDVDHYMQKSFRIVNSTRIHEAEEKVKAAKKLSQMFLVIYATGQLHDLLFRLKNEIKTVLDDNNVVLDSEHKQNYFEWKVALLREIDSRMQNLHSDTRFDSLTLFQKHSRIIELDTEIKDLHKSNHKDSLLAKHRCLEDLCYLMGERAVLSTELLPLENGIRMRQQEAQYFDVAAKKLLVEIEIWEKSIIAAAEPQQALRVSENLHHLEHIYSTFSERIDHLFPFISEIMGTVTGTKTSKSQLKLQELLGTGSGIIILEPSKLPYIQEQQRLKQMYAAAIKEYYNREILK